MWQITKIQASNLLSFKELEFQPNTGCTTLVFGQNLDNDSQQSNGSGKSALIEAIAIGLTGETLRKVKSEELINDASDECSIYLELSNTSSDSLLTVARSFYRKGSQTIDITWNKDPMVLSSVIESNRWLLSTIGLTKEDVFSTFVLSKHKYTSFLSASDKDKKEIINKFSNGVLVDQAVEYVKNDLELLENDLYEIEKEAHIAKGRVDAMELQLEGFIADRDGRFQEIQSRIKDWEGKVAVLRGEIRRHQQFQSMQGDKISLLNEIYNKVADYEETASVKSVDVAVGEIRTILKDCDINFSPSVNEKDLVQAMKKATRQLSDAEEALFDVQKSFDKASAEIDIQKVNAEKEKKALSNAGREKKEYLAVLKKKEGELIEEKATMERELSGLRTRLAVLDAAIDGVVSCPKCSHQFSVSDGAPLSEMSKERGLVVEKIDVAKSTVEQISENIVNSSKEYRDIFAKAREIADAIAEVDRVVVDKENQLLIIQQQLTKAKSLVESSLYAIRKAEKDLEDAVGAVFEEAFDLIDNATNSAKSSIRTSQDEENGASNSIVTYEASIAEAKSIDFDANEQQLRDRLEAYRLESQEIDKKVKTAEALVSAQKKQEATFVAFKTHLANSKIEALASITNEFLQKIGSDIRIVFSGYTVLKSGKVRDKISISLMRDGIDCGSFEKFSEGEKARVNIANILAMHYLCNVNCEEDKGLDLIVLDEILEATDEAGLANIFEAMNSIGTTGLVVSHGNVAENYPHKLVIGKQNGFSFIKE